MKVTIFNTSGKKRQVVEANNVTTWGELKKVLIDEGVQVDNKKAIIGENQVTLESSKAILPADFDFTLFLTPIKVKNGNVVDVDSMNYKECRAFIKDNGGSDKFGDYTHMSTEKMRIAIKGFLAVNSNSEEVEGVDTIELVDNCIEALNNLREALINGSTNKDDEETIIDSLDAWYSEIKSNLE